MNVIDEARYVLAEHYAASDRVPDAVAALEDTAAATPDAETRSVTRFNLGMIYQEKLGDQVRARAAFSKVTGRMAATARNRIIAPLRREKNWAEAVEFLKECLEHADEPKDRADVVRQLIQVARTCGDEGLMESVLSSVPGMISYEDAQKELRSRRAKLEETREARMELAQPARLRGREIKRKDRDRPAPAARLPLHQRGPKSEPKSRRRKEWPRRSVEPPPPVGRGGAGAEEGEAPPGF